MGELLRPDRVHEVAAELVALQRAAYAVEAALIGSDAIPPLRDTVETLIAAGLSWFGAREGTALLGAVAIHARPDLVDIERLVVSPTAFRRGVGSRLVQHVLALAGRRRVTVSTGRDNIPACALYTRLGFTVTGEEEVVPGLWVARFAHAG